MKRIIKEGPLSKFAKIGVKESIDMVMKQCSKYIDHFNQGIIDAETLKTEITKTIELYEDYLPSKDIWRILDSTDEIIDSNYRLKKNNNILNGIEREINNLKNALESQEKDFKIELDLFNKKIHDDYGKFLKEVFHESRYPNFIMDFEETLNKQMIVDGQPKIIGDVIVDIFKTQKDIDNYLTKEVIRFDNVYLMSIKPYLDPESILEFEKLLNNTQTQRIQRLQDKVRSFDSYNKKFM
jgi:hypothetical protein